MVFTCESSEADILGYHSINKLTSNQSVQKRTLLNYF